MKKKSSHYGGNPFGTNPTNPQFYINNDLEDGGATINTEMDGLTVVLSVQAQVVSGQLNHIKLAIADASDDEFDSKSRSDRKSPSTSPSQTSAPTPRNLS
ncbi:MAG: choice-of-anchor L domain-containing protein [Blastocatellia bacterium]